MGEQNGTCDLAHELSHAFDDNNKWMDYALIDGVEKNEWVACYRENLIRKELGYGYRTHYIVKWSPEGHFLGGSKPDILSNDEPFLPFDIQSYEKRK